MKTIPDLCHHYKVKGYWEHPSGLVAVRHKRMYLWFQFSVQEQIYKQLGSTLTKEGGTYCRVRNLEDEKTEYKEEIKSDTSWFRRLR